MGAQLGALAGVQAALEERAEDGGFDVGPIQPADATQNLQAVAVQLQHGVVLEQPAVEMLDLIGPEPAAGGHGPEQRAELLREARRLLARLLGQAGEEVGRQQTDVFGKQAEQQPNEEVGRLLRTLAPPTQQIGQPRELAGRLPGDLLRGLRRAQLRGVVEGVVEMPALLGHQQIVQCDRVDALDGVGEVGVNEDAFDIGDDEERRVLQRLAVLEQLLIGAVQVGVLALVLPGEVALLPDVGPALTAALFGGAGFEGEPRAVGVGLGRRRVVEEPADVDEVFLGGGAFFQRGVPPLGDEVLR